MEEIREFLQTVFGTAKEALRQMELAAPHYWDGAIATVARAALLALLLFAAVLFVQLMILLFAREKDLWKIFAFAGTLAAVLALCVWVLEPLTEAAGDISPAWGAPGAGVSEQADA